METLILTLNKLSKADFWLYLKKQTTKDIKNMISYCDEIYFNDKNPVTLLDEYYDIMKDFVVHDNCIGKLPNKCTVSLPVSMPSMNKIKADDDIKVLERWITKNKAKEYIVESKLDGVSILCDFDGKNLSLFTRGNGKIGTDVSQIQKHLKLPKLTKKLRVRGELIIKDKIFNDKYADKYQNARNMISGLVNASTYNDVFTDIDFVVYEIIDNLTPLEQLKKLKKLGFNVVNYDILNIIDNETLKNKLIQHKHESLYTIDGIIIQTNTVHIRPDKNPDYAFAFKMCFESVDAVVKNVEWNVSKLGILKPRIRIEPVFLQGSNIEFVTGFNGKYIYENDIGPGTILKIIKSGDVIPHIKEVVESTYAQLPNVLYSWNESKVDFIIQSEDKENIDKMKIKMLTSFFSKIGAKFLSDKTVEKLYMNGYNDIFKIIKMKEDDYMKLDSIKEKSAQRLYNSIHKSLKNSTLSTVIGSSGILGPGISIRKTENLLEFIPDMFENKYNVENLTTKINNIIGFGDKNIDIIIYNYDKAYIFANKIKPYIKQDEIVTNNIGPLTGQFFCFSGFRDVELKHKINISGGKIVDNVSTKLSMLIVKDYEQTSTKTILAQKLNIPILTKEEFRQKNHKL